MAVISIDDGYEVRNRPENLSITYRQYSAGADMTKWDEPDNLVKYWMTDWMYKKDRDRYERKYPDREFMMDLRSDTGKTLNRLRTAITLTDSQEIDIPAPSCAVCGDELDGDEHERVLGKKVHIHHTVRELASEGVVGRNKSKNRRWE